jgi:rhodanese-related sulfurtransferase
MDFFKTFGFLSHGVINVTPADCINLCKAGAVLIDVREENLRGYKAFNIENVVYIPFSRIKMQGDDLPDDIPLIIGDTTGLKSRECTLFLMESGFKNVANLAGGIVEWERDGFPVKINPDGKLTGSCMCQLKKREGVKRRGEEKEN